MKIGIIASHSWPVKLFADSPYTGDFFYALLAKTLDELGHTISFFAPANSYRPPNGNLYEMPCSFGKYPPAGQACETHCLAQWNQELLSQDVIHDFSTYKLISENMSTKLPVIQSQLGGVVSYPPHNVVFMSDSQRERAARGATDYEHSPTPNLAGASGPIVNGKFVHCGIDTDFYCPGDGLMIHKEDFYLWLGKWHPVRGYYTAIQMAIRTNLKLLLAGPEPTPDQAPYVEDIQKLIAGYHHINLMFLPNSDQHHYRKRTLLQQAKALLATTQFNEPFGLTMAEALACGTPIVTTNYGNMPEFITNGITGKSCDNNLTELAAAMIEIQKGANHLTSLACRNQAVAKFDRKVMTAGYLKLYNDVMNGVSW